jgi:hypothetical protein
MDQIASSLTTVMSLTIDVRNRPKRTAGNSCRNRTDPSNVAKQAHIHTENLRVYVQAQNLARPQIPYPSSQTEAFQGG